MKEITVNARIPGSNDRRMYKIQVDLENQIQECSHCHKLKDFSEFSKDNRRKQYGGITHICVRCFDILNPAKDTAICSNCDKEKLLAHFHKNKSRKNGHDFYCKPCRMDIVKHHYDPKRHKNLRNRYKKEWETFFIQQYGEHPSCQVCEKPLNYFNNIKTESVHWDHRHGKTDNYRAPGEWLSSRPCSESNISKWLEFDFGILCHNCNKSIPTENREEWIRKTIKYVFGEGCGILRLNKTKSLPPLDWDY